MQDISAIIVDDESLAREQVSRFLEEAGGFHIADRCASGQEAIRSIIEHQPDVVFLDIEMPEINGFDVLDSVDGKGGIYWVFVTAYDRYAVKAFEVEASDYLLKPYDRKRFLKTVTRIRSELRNGGAKDREERPEPLEKLLVKDNDRIKLIDCGDIVSIASEGNYIVIQTADSDSYTIRYALKDIALKLHRRRFFRIHRSMIVNIDYIRAIEPWFAGDYKVELTNGETLKMSRNYKDVLESFK